MKRKNQLLNINFMKQTKLFISTLILVSLLCFSCNGKNSNATTDKDSSESNTASTSTSSSGDVSFYCKIDGKEFSGNGSDNLSNAAIKTSPGIINFVLVPMKSGQKGVPAQISFFIADKGATTIHGDDNANYHVKYSPGGIDNDLNCKQMTVIITSSDASGLKGTFNGIFTDPKNIDKEVTCTDGIFNIPWSPHSKK